MRFAKKTHLFLLFIFLLIGFPIVSSAALFTVEIDGLGEPVSEIQSFSIWFSVDEAFTFSDFSFGSAVSQAEAGQVLGWDSQSEIVTDIDRGLVFKIGGLDRDGAFMGNYFDLKNGTICTFEYSGLILGMTDILQISNRDGVNMYEALNLDYDLSPEGLKIAPIPIPPAFLLLGGGLLGLVGIRRKRMK